MTHRSPSSRAPRVCNEPGCPALVLDGNRCERHSPNLKRACLGCARIISTAAGAYCSTCRPDTTTPPRWTPYNNPRWRKLSAVYRKRHPVCERCRLQPSAHTHHRDGLGPDGPRGADWENLMALCRSCHSRATASTGGGFGNPRRAA